MQYWITNNGTGNYFENTLPNSYYDAETCILVPQRPELWARWESGAWNTCNSYKIDAYRLERNRLLRLTDKLMISDYYATFAPDKQLELTTYRYNLRNFSSIEPYDLPSCPNWIDLLLD